MSQRCSPQSNPSIMTSWGGQELQSPPVALLIQEGCKVRWGDCGETKEEI